MTYFKTWLASPARVLAFICRLMTATTIVTPFALMTRFHEPAFLFLLLVMSLPMWALMTVAVHGPNKMVLKPTSTREWLWCHVTAWWVTPK